jgi:3-hydroxyacyl-CoA dehydrogenase
MLAIRSAAVLGAGTMGAQIAAQLANAGFPVRLLDITATAAREGLDRAKAARPDPFFTPHTARLISTGGFDEHLGTLSSADWIVEAIVERLDVKQDLLSRVEAVAAPHAVVSSNTSGIPLSAIAEGRSERFRQRWLGTHFFNPPRYLHLLEVIPIADTLPEVVDLVSRCADRRLGKGVVLAKDTPNFIANHLGLFGVTRTFGSLAGGDYTIEEIDAITGPAIGRPKSATFRTMDIAGIDVLAHVTRNLAERLDSEDARARFAPAPLVDALLQRGWIGVKAGQGFYKKTADGILTLDPEAMAYRPAARVRLPSLDSAGALEHTADRLRTLFLGNDRVGRFLRDTLGQLLIYAARVTPEIAFSIDDVDRAMRWGFGWELGPFETWDAIGIQDVLTACDVKDPPPLVVEALARGAFRLAAPGAPPSSRPARVPPAAPDFELLRVARERGGLVRGNAACSLVDLGDGVLGVEFHSKMNAIGGDAIQMLHAGVKEASANFRALVVGNEGVNFSAGANLLLLLLEAQEGNWDELDVMVRGFQRATMSLKYADVPAVVAPAGLALGGGCEICLHGDRVFAAAETYIGLAEAGVGLIPAGGGTKEMLVRAMQACGDRGDPLPHLQAVFETIGFARVSSSGEDARRYGYLRPVDEVTMNRDRLIAGAKAMALSRAADYVKPQPPASIRVGGESVQAALKLGVYLARRGGRISDHDALIGHKLAWLLSGGDLAHAGAVSEQHLLDLEREAFLSLCGERLTQERIAHTLKTGKPLRN